jgi:PAS domain-containing protein
MVLSIGIILSSVFLYFRNPTRFQSSSGDRSFVPSFIEGSANEPSNDTMETLDPETAIGIVRAALGNRDASLVEGFFILGSSAGTPQEAIAILDILKTNEGSPDGLEPLGGRLTSGRLAEEVVVTSVKDGRMSIRLAQLFLVGGRWRIDLDSYTRHANPSWEDILGRKCDAATVRVFVASDSYYNGERYVEVLWKCYALISPDIDEILFGYAARGSEQEKALDAILAKEEELHKATIKILTKTKQRRVQFEISRVFADDWSVGEPYLDESF